MSEAALNNWLEPLLAHTMYCPLDAPVSDCTVKGLKLPCPARVSSSTVNAELLLPELLEELLDELEELEELVLLEELDEDELEDVLALEDELELEEELEEVLPFAVHERIVPVESSPFPWKPKLVVAPGAMFPFQLILLAL